MCIVELQNGQDQENIEELFMLNNGENKQDKNMFEKDYIEEDHDEFF